MQNMSQWQHLAQLSLIKFLCDHFRILLLCIKISLVVFNIEIQEILNFLVLLEQFGVYIFFIVHFSFNIPVPFFVLTSIFQNLFFLSCNQFLIACSYIFFQKKRTLLHQIICKIIQCKYLILISLTLKKCCFKFILVD